ncbi:MAG TPA: class I SAM-dependent methyltransferase [Bryobacteraceae bacterium]|nr:class I SAM-dependent methyltransferase [Bryobacteraceae bacterium]
MTVEPDYTVRDQQRMESAKRYFEWQSDLAERHLGRRVLEVGCGLGNFTQHLIDREFVVGIDVEPACVHNHRQRFRGRANVTSEYLDVLSPEFLELRRYQPQSIACLNVLEHVKDDALALQHMNAVLPAGGTAVLIVPAFKALYGPIDEHLGHYRRYTKRSLTQVAQTAGFEVRILRFLNSVGFFGWWCNAKILKKTEQSSAQIKIFDSLLVPILSRTERWIEPPVGQSLFTVLVKP